ncbi:MAG: TlpA disulfide reductase family protein [Anaerolineae bacterium]|nr:TlpA family protein disulfide reductase [Thermoflexales bacterium]MDW8406188.1 TlpA disulfide reductase family protein [Anaerolineae bacterium]
MSSSPVSPKRLSPWPIVILAGIASLFGFGAGLLIASTANQPAAPASLPAQPVMQFLRENEPAPDFQLQTFDGRAVRLSDFKGRPVLINFWASWCPPCREETPDLVAAYEQLQDINAVFIGIGTNDDTEKLKQFAQEYAVPYLIVEDPLGDVSRQYRVLGMPTTFLVDKDGILRKIVNGVVTKEQVITLMRELAR